MTPERRLCALTLACLLLLFAAACGKKGDPVPLVKKDLFTFEAVRASAAGECILVQGLVRGGVENVESFHFELAPVQGPEDCPGCPFNPRETATYSSTRARLDLDDGSFSFTYCPTVQADIQRWRLVGHNSFPGVPYVMTPPRIVVMTESENFSLPE